MEDPGAVRMMEGLQQRAGQAQRRIQGHRSPLEVVAQGLAPHVLHRDERCGIGFAGFVEGRDGGMLQARAGRRFAQQPFAQRRVEGVADDLDGRVPAERQVAGQVDLPHPACSQPGFDRVVAQRLSDHDSLDVPARRGWYHRVILRR